ncbi:EPIDERMAL PATTERNING FACTOR-like protein 3 [Senna tora]|uniref:Epidermal patterning factor-like protein n=1 Tax=Senna tora TaxID=362788 RepID=A0A834SMW3_9FABA|nr:EPIDERMAL PATTERNING FACTOR-like protein 3 [Senna tora]
MLLHYSNFHSSSYNFHLSNKQQALIALFSCIILNLKHCTKFSAIDQTPRTQHVQEPAFEGNEGMENGYKKTGRGLSRIGSRPPRCEHKCKGCVPCDPIQIPTSRGHRVQYANYEPEGWKCKCGTSYYNP